jgi:glycine/D-amino acid oxidase-like deaminating enzyme/nitrite reductase/ring-hydroxylating ferredoxin subunit
LHCIATEGFAMSNAPKGALDTTPYWAASLSSPAFERLAHDEHADVVVVGGGITGLTAAYELATAGRRVVLLERAALGEIDTGHTTAHLTMVTDTRLGELVDRFGRSHAQAVWDGGLAAIDRIDTIVRRHAIDCHFDWVEGYQHAPFGSMQASEAEQFRTEAALARELGFDAEFVDAVPLVGGPGLRVDGQARFHPRLYLAGLAQAVVAAGGRIYEHSAVETFNGDPLGVTANGYAVTADDIVIATHNPLAGLSSLPVATLFQTKLALYTSYVVAGQVPKGRVTDALWWDTADPYHYLRVEPGAEHDIVIFGGEDHKTGQVKGTPECYARLEAALRVLLPDATIVARWSGQVIETPDGLPYLGRMGEHHYAATGFAGNGMTFGTLGGMLCADAILGRTNPWAELFSPDRKALGRSLWDYVKENADYPYYMARDRFAGVEGRSLREVRRGRGKVIEHEGQTVAAYRDEDGVLSLRSATCTHMGCLVGWNPAERTWDCPCHGSRFTPRGEVIAGPAESPLAPVEP